MGEYIQKWSVKNENQFFKSGYWHGFWNSRYGTKILDFSENSGRLVTQHLYVFNFQADPL